MISIASRAIGPGHPIFLQAELGVTTIGDLKRTFALIDVCAEAGMDACKFIVTDPEKVESRPERSFAYESAVDLASGGFVMARRHQPIGDLLRETMFTFDEWTQIRDYCHTRGLIFYATADHLEAVEMLEALQAPAYKICAWDLTYRPLIEAIGRTRKPVLVDVGTAKMSECADVTNWLGRDWMRVLAPHPHGAQDWHLARYDDPWGFSSPGRESWCDFAALGRGASLIEKRLTLRRDETRGHHHAVSLEPDELRDWVQQIRLAEAALNEAPFGGSLLAWGERAENDRREELGWRRR